MHSAAAAPRARVTPAAFSEDDVPRLDPGPRRKRGPGFKTRGSKTAPDGRRLRGAALSFRATEIYLFLSQ